MSEASLLLDLPMEWAFSEYVEKCRFFFVLLSS